MGLKVGESESEPFWTEFIGSLKERGLTGVALVTSNAHKGLTYAIRRMLQGSCWLPGVNYVRGQTPTLIAPGPIKGSRQQPLGERHQQTAARTNDTPSS